MKWVCFIAATITLCKYFKKSKFKKVLKQVFEHQVNTIKETSKEAWDFVKTIANHPFYNKLGIGVNALFLLTCSLYGAFLFAVKINEGHSISLLLILLTIFMAASINFFYQSIKLYK